MEKKPKILVVDDERGTRQLLESILTQYHYDVRLVESGDDAFQLLEIEQDFDIILLDVVMFGMDGIEILKKIRQDANLSDIRIIMSSGLSEPKEMVEAFLAGASDYIIKPVNAIELIARIETQLRLKKIAKKGGIKE